MTGTMTTTTEQAGKAQSREATVAAQGKSNNRKNGRPAKNPVEALNPSPGDDAIRRDIRKAVKYTTEHLKAAQLQEFKAEQHVICTRFLSKLSEAAGLAQSR